MKYLFILGRNVELSKEEVFCYLNKEGINVLGSKLIDNGLLVDIDGSIDGGVIDELGGSISIGQVLCDLKNINKFEVYLGEKNNITYCLYEFNPSVDIRDYLKTRFRQEKLKASEKPLNNIIKGQDGEDYRIAESRLLDEGYFVFEDLFGKIIQKTNYEKIEKRDMEKPFRRESLSISPRLSKIMINLSMAKKGETLLDCFCGIGVILQEALLQEIKVIGIDNDNDAVNKCRKNLEWAKFRKENYKLINGDSGRVSVGKINVIVCEPDLGETLRKIPSPDKARQILERYEKLMGFVLRNLKNQVKGRIVFTSPLIKTHKKRVSCSIEKIIPGIDLKPVKRFDEYREGQIVGRQIFVLER